MSATNSPPVRPTLLCEGSTRTRPRACSVSMVIATGQWAECFPSLFRRKPSERYCIPTESYKLSRMPEGSTKRRPITVSALLDAAMELFAEQGYGATSIPDICARAGLTKGAFYSNFANKDALFLALLDRSWERRAADPRRDAGRRRARRCGRDPTRVPGLVVDRQWTLVSVEFSLHAIRHPDVALLLVQHEVRVRSELAVLVTEALEPAGRIPTLPVDELARMIVAVTEGSDIQELTDGQQVASSDLGPSVPKARAIGRCSDSARCRRRPCQPGRTR